MIILVNKTFMGRKKTFEPVTDTMKNFSEKITKTTMLISKQNKKTLEILNDKVSGISNDRGIMGSYLLSSQSKTKFLKVLVSSN